MTNKKKDILYSIVLIAFSIAAIIYADVSIDQRVVQYTLARPDRYIQLWLLALLVLSVLLLIRTIRNNDQKISSKMIYPSVIVSIVVFLVFLIVIPKIGFTISSFLFLFAMTLYYNILSLDQKPEKKELLKMILIAFIYSVVLAVGASLLFRKVLNVRLPDIIF